MRPFIKDLMISCIRNVSLKTKAVLDNDFFCPKCIGKNADFIKSLSDYRIRGMYPFSCGRYDLHFYC